MSRVDTRAKRTRNQRILTASDLCHICGEPDDGSMGWLIIHNSLDGRETNE